MTKAMLTKVILGLLVATLARPPIAEAAYLGTVSSQDGYQFEMVTGANVSWSVTFLSVVRGKLVVDNVITGNGGTARMAVTVSRTAERLILLLDTRGGSAALRMFVGGNQVEIIADENSDSRAVFDVTG